MNIYTPRGRSSVVSQYGKLPRRFHKVYGEIKPVKASVNFPAVITQTRMPANLADCR